MDQISPEFVEHIPEHPRPGILYISKRYATALHLCCCGCGTEVVTPLNPAKWHLNDDGGRISLSPSIGNWSFPCQSHYWIERNSVRWAAAMTPDVIAAVKARDRRDADAMAPKSLALIPGLRLALAEALSRIVGWWRG